MSASIDKRSITIKSDDRAGQQPVPYCVEYVFYLRGKKRSVTRQHLVDEKYCDGKKDRTAQPSIGCLLIGSCEFSERARLLKKRENSTSVDK